MNRPSGLGRLANFNVSVEHPYFLHYRTLNKALLDVSHFASGLLLDIGCGNKPYSSMFASVDKYIGCDVVESSERKVDVISYASALPFPSDSFDTLFSTQVIEHVPNPLSVFGEAFRVLKGGGHFIVSGPMYWHLHEEPHDYLRFTKYGFRYLLETAGFEVIQITANGGKWAVLGQVIIHTLQGGRFYRPPLIRWINRLFSGLDDSRFDEVNTLNYVVLARKV